MPVGIVLTCRMFLNNVAFNQIKANLGNPWEKKKRSGGWGCLIRGPWLTFALGLSVYKIYQINVLKNWNALWALIDSKIWKTLTVSHLIKTINTLQRTDNLSYWTSHTMIDSLFFLPPPGYSKEHHCFAQPWLNRPEIFNHHLAKKREKKVSLKKK